MSPIRIFVGCAPNHEDAESQAVLEHSIRKHASMPVDITWMKLSRDPESPFSGWHTELWPTPFSGFRWAIPALCEFHGRAIYMDSDIIVMGDIAELWNMEFLPGKHVIAKSHNRLCVSLWDCEGLAGIWPTLNWLRAHADNHGAMRRLMTNTKGIVQPFPDTDKWNCFDGEDEDDLYAPHIKAIHYTAMRHQPHLPHAIGRLEKEERRHWFDGKPEPHWRPDLMYLFYQLLGEARPVSDYCQEPPYGDYRKRSVGSVGKPKWTSRV